MSDASVKSLQAAINRYAGPGNFPAVGVDGVFGPKTAAGAIAALKVLAVLPRYAVTAQGLLAILAPGGLPDHAKILGASGLAQYLAGSANELNLAATLPSVPAGSPPIAPPTFPYPAPSTAVATAQPTVASILTPSTTVLGVRIPNKALYIGGGVLALAIVALIATRKKPAQYAA